MSSQRPVNHRRRRARVHQHQSIALREPDACEAVDEAAVP